MGVAGGAAAVRKKRILLIAPVPTHPSTTGAGARVRWMAETLARLGHDVHFLHLQQPLRMADAELRAAWADRLHVFRSLSPMSCLARGRRKLLRITAKTLEVNLPVDAYYDPAAGPYVGDLLARLEIDVAIVSYVFYSRLLEALPEHVLKVLDTHDVFSDRYGLYREHGQRAEFFSTSPEEERRALDRADVVLAISGADAEHFRPLTRRPVVVVGHLAAPEPGATRAGPPCKPVMLFVGGPMGINVHAVSWFLREVLPRVRRRLPEAELWLAGGIGRRFARHTDGVRCLGFVSTIGDVYRRAAVVINPQQFGTGLSIKGIEALAYGRPLVTTPSGARGLEAGDGTAFLTARTPTEFADALTGLLERGEQAAALACGGAAFARRYHRANVAALSGVVSGAGAW